jgi:hypothetical protein
MTSLLTMAWISGEWTVELLLDLDRVRVKEKDFRADLISGEPSNLRVGDPERERIRRPVWEEKAFLNRDNELEFRVKDGRFEPFVDFGEVASTNANFRSGTAKSVTSMPGFSAPTSWVSDVVAGSIIGSGSCRGSASMPLAIDGVGGEACADGLVPLGEVEAMSIGLRSRVLQWICCSRGLLLNRSP